MQIKLLIQLTTSEVRLIARSAANRDEPLDTANVFAIGTDHHAAFTTAYLSQLSVLEEVAQEFQRAFLFDVFSDGPDCNPDIPIRTGNGIRDP